MSLDGERGEPKQEMRDMFSPTPVLPVPKRESSDRALKVLDKPVEMEKRLTRIENLVPEPFLSRFRGVIK